jgi:hypothetical protein
MTLTMAIIGGGLIRHHPPAAFHPISRTRPKSGGKVAARPRTVQALVEIVAKGNVNRSCGKVPQRCPPMVIVSTSGVLPKPFGIRPQGWPALPGFQGAKARIGKTP